MNTSKWLMGVSVLALTLDLSVPAALAATKSLGMVPASGAPADAPADDVPTLLVTNKPMSAVLPGGGGRGISTDDLDNGTLDAKGARPLRPSVPGLVSTSNTGIYKGMMTEAPNIGADAVLSKDYFSPANTMAAQKIDQLREEMFTLQSRVSELSERLSGIQQVGQELSANYYASVATINTQLQSGTTPGNPRLMERLTAAQDALAGINTIRVFGPKDSAGILSFEMQGVHPHDIGTILDEANVAIRAGHHCAQPLMDHLGVPATARASFGVYSNSDDVEALVRGLDRVRRIFG